MNSESGYPKKTTVETFDTLQANHLRKMYFESNYAVKGSI